MLLEACQRLRSRDLSEAAMESAIDCDDEDAFEAAELRFAEADNAAATHLATPGYSTDPWPPGHAIDELLADAERQLDSVIGTGLEQEARRLRIAEFRRSP